MITTVRVLGLRAGDFGTVATAARRVVGYVQGSTGRRRTSTMPAGAAGYFTEGLARGRARGGGGGLVGLRGEVEPLHLERILTGGHARTGLALLGARGSAGRASAGTPPPPGRPDDLLGLGEAARIAGVDVGYLRRLARRTGHPDPDPDPDPAGLPREDRLAAVKDPGSGRWVVRRDELDRFLRDRERPTVVMGFDVTCAVPKSVSLLWAFGDDDLKADIAVALDAGIDAVIAYLERHAAVGRLDGHNRPGLGLAAASYLHEVARSDEAHLHVHTIVANAIAVPLLDDDGYPVRDDQGGARVEWRALDSEVFLAHVQTAGFLGAAALRHELSRRRGLAWAPVRNGVAELAAFPRQLLEAFSTRAGQVAEEFAQLVAAGFEPSPGTRATAQRASRPPKKIWADKVIRRIQHDRLTAAGWTPGQVHALGTPVARDLPRPGATDTAELADDLTGPGGLTARSTTFGRQEILRAVAGWGGDRLDARDVVALGERLAADPRIVLVKRDAPRRHHDPEPVFTTVNLLEAEDSVLALCRQGRVAHGGPPRHLLPPDILEDVLAGRLPDAGPGGPQPAGRGTAVGDRLDPAPAATPGESRPAGAAAPGSGASGDADGPAGALPALSDDQRRAVRAVLASPDLVRPVIGPAGSGKTEAMRHVTAVLTGAGYRIVGAAHGGRQAEHLATRLGVESRVVASWLTLLDHAADAALVWPARTVLIVDEATQVDTRDAERLLRYATRTATVVVALGDPAQLPAVGAGGWFTHLVAATPDAVSLTTAHRQSGPAMAEVRAALAGLRDDTGTEARGALRQLAADGRIRLFDDRDALLAAVVADWYTEHTHPHHPASTGTGTDSGDTRAGGGGGAGGGPAGGTTMLAETHHDVELLNQAARGCLRADGTLTGPALQVAGRQFQVGDQVITLTQHGHTLVPAGKPASAFIRTGTPGHVTAVHLDPDHPGRQALTVTFPTKGAVHVGWDYLTHTFPDGRDGGLAHAYAITAHKAQGATLATARAVVPDTTSRPGLYVMLSRARTDLAAYVIRRGDLDTDPDDENWLPVLRDSHGPLERLADRLARSRAERMASDHDPHAATAHTLAARHTLAELAALRRAATRAAHPPDAPNPRRAPDRRDLSDAPPPQPSAGRPGAPDAASAPGRLGTPAPPDGAELPVIRRAERAAEAAVATRALTDPPATLRSRIGPRPGAGPTRTVWDQAVTALAIYHARYEPPTPAHTPGPPPDPDSPDAADAARWHEQRGHAARTARTWAGHLPGPAAARFTGAGDRVARDRAIAGIHALLDAGWQPRRLLDALTTHDEDTVRSAAAILDHRVAALTATAALDAADYTDPPPPSPAEHWHQMIRLLTAAEINHTARRRTADLTAEIADLRGAFTAASRAAAARRLAADSVPMDVATVSGEQEEARRRLRRATTDLAASLLLRDAADTRLRLSTPGRTGSRQAFDYDEAVRAAADADQQVLDAEDAVDLARALHTALTPESPPGDVDTAGDYLEHRQAVTIAALDRHVDDACLHATTEPAAYLTDLLGARPTEPAHATGWDSRVRAIEHHRHHTLGLAYDTPAAPGNAPPAHRALGLPPHDPDRQRDYQAILDNSPQPHAEPGL